MSIDQTYYDDWGQVFSLMNSPVGLPSATEYKLENSDGTITALRGTGFTYDVDGNLSGGTITGANRIHSDGSTILVATSGISLPVSDIIDMFTAAAALGSQITWAGVLVLPANEPAEMTESRVVLLNSDGTSTVINGSFPNIDTDEDAFFDGGVTSIEHLNADGSTASPAITGLSGVSGRDVVSAMFPEFAASHSVFQMMEVQDNIIEVLQGQHYIEPGAGNDVVINGSSVEGGPGNDRIIGTTTQSNFLSGDAGNDTITGGDQWDNISGGTGNDDLTGGAGGDTFSFWENNFGDDIIRDFDPSQDRIEISRFVGVSSFEDLNIADVAGNAVITVTGQGTITLESVSAANLNAQNVQVIIFGTYGDDALVGTAGDDQINGLGGNDLINAGLGSDAIQAGDGNDTVDGSSGQDFINGGWDNDQLTGGADRDTFQYYDEDNGDDVITDFTPGEDIIQIVNDAAPDLASLVILDNANGNAVIAFGNLPDPLPATGDGLVGLDIEGLSTITVLGLTAAQMTDAGNFQFGNGPGAGLDPSDPQISLGTAGADEGQDLVFAVTLSHATDHDVSMQYTVVGGTADGSDVGSTGGTLTISAGATSAEIRIPTVQDSDVEPDESVELLLDAAVGGHFGGAGSVSATGYILNDDSAGGGSPTPIDGTTGDDPALTGSEDDDHIRGLEGNDMITGLGGADSIEGGAGIDVLFGGAGADTLDAGGNNGEVDDLIGGAGNDQLTGVAGSHDFDRVRYDLETGGGAVNVDLSTGTATDTHGDIDQLTNIDEVRGTSLADSFTGGTEFNRFVGLGGVDSYDGSAGDNDEVDFRRDASEGGTAAVNLDLGAATGTDGFGNNEVLTDIEHARGTAGDDTLTGSGDDNRLRGEGGNDLIDGQGGLDRLEGGAGDDTLTGGGGNDAIDGGADNDTAVYSGIRADYDIQETAGVVTVTDMNASDGDNGVDILTNVETLQFADAVYAVGAAAPDPVVSISGETDVEGSFIDFTVTLDAPAAHDVIVNYATADGTATDGQDYSGGTGQVTIAAGTTGAAISIASTDDTDAESDEDFTVTLTAATGATIGRASATGIIADNEAGPLPTPGFWAEVLNFDPAEARVNSAGTYVIMNNTDGSKTVLLGTGLAVDGNGLPAAGTITGVNLVAPTGTLAAKVTGLNVSYASVGAALTAHGLMAAMDPAWLQLIEATDFSAAGAIVPTATALTINHGDGTQTVIHGTGLPTDPDAQGPTGTITAIEHLDAGGAVIAGHSHSGLAQPLTESLAIFGDDLGSIAYELIMGGDNPIELRQATPFMIDGAGGADDITGSNASGDTLGAGAGDDTLDGRGGDDTLLGDSGNDQLHGGGGHDNLQGGDGADSLFGDDGNDTLDGGLGDDQLYGGRGFNEIDGGSGLDYVRYDDGNYGKITASLADQTQNAGVAAGDTYAGIEGLVLGNVNDIGYGTAGDDHIFGMSGNDKLYGGEGADLLDGGAGLDYVRFDDANYGNLVVSLGDQSINTGAAAGDTYVDIEGLVLGNAHDKGYGTSGDDYIFGMSGHDRLYGGEGGDYLNGGRGFDYVRFDDADYGNLTVSLADQSINTGAAAGDTYLGIEGLVLGRGNDSGFGTAGNDYIYGMSGHDKLYGGEGGDFLHGGRGLDYVRFDDANYGDLVASLDNQGLNTGAAAGDRYSSIEGLVMGVGNDVAQGDAGINYLYGLSGNDTLEGMGGDDFLNGGRGSDVFVYNAGDGVDTIRNFEGGTGHRDQLDLSSFGFTDFSQVLASSATVGLDTVITLGVGDQIVLEDFYRGNFAADDVIIS